jgi:glycosyltransferase involved in cell wall biosynthesis
LPALSIGSRVQQLGVRLLVSIVMPCFNVADTVSRTIRSVCNQTFTSFELLAVDDGSVDRTVDIIRDRTYRHMPAQAQLRVLSQENRGPGAARNRGMSEARGEIIAFLDADDLWSPEYLATVAAAFHRLPQLDALASNSWDLLRGGYHLNVERHRNDEVLIIDDFFKAVLQGTMVVRTSGISIRRSVVSRVGCMREDLLRSQDREYWARLAASQVCWGFSPEPLVVYNGMRAKSVSNNESRFVNVPSPEMWSREIWPLLDSSMQDGFRGWYMERAREMCREALQAGLDDQARATAKEALSRAADRHDTLFFLAVRHTPKKINRFVWPAGAWAKGLLRKARGTRGLTHTVSDMPSQP